MKTPSEDRIKVVAARIGQWLAEGRDVRIKACEPLIPGCALMELWDDSGVEVLTTGGTIHERREPRDDVT